MPDQADSIPIWQHCDIMLPAAGGDSQRVECRCLKVSFVTADNDATNDAHPE
jgi:hypothetical protein